MTGADRRELSPWFRRVLLAAVLLFVTAGHLAWLSVDSAVTGYDELAFLEHLVKYQRVLAVGGPGDWFGWLGFSSYPGLPFFAGSIFARLGDYSLLSVRLTGVFFHLLWIVLIYLIGRRLDAPVAGLVAALLVGLSPLANILARHYASFAVVGAMTTLAVYALVRTRMAVGARGILLVGLAAGAALLSERGTPVLYLAGPFLYAVLDRYFGVDRQRPWRAVWQPGLAAAVAALLAAGYLVGYVNANLGHTFAQAQTAVIAGRPWTFYWERLATFLAGPLAAPLCLVALGVAAWRRDRRVLLPLLWFAVPFAVLSSVATRDMVYALSLTAPLALLAGLGAHYLPRRWWVAAPALLLLFFALLNYIRVGNPAGEIARGTRDVEFFGLIKAHDVPFFGPRFELDERCVRRVIDDADADADTVWILTGATVSDQSPRRKEIGDAVRLLSQLRGVPGRFLLSLEDLFPDGIQATGIDQHIVVAPAAAAPAGSFTSALAGPVFDPREHLRLEPKVRDELARLRLTREATAYCGTVRFTRWRASLP